MAYRRDGALINRSIPFLVLSKALTWLVEIIGYPIVKILYGFKRFGGPIPSSPHILVSNHVMPLDPLLHAIAILPRFTYFTLLEETVLTPVLGTFIRLLGGIPIPTDPDRLPALEEAIGAAVRERGRAHFYPEGECFLFNQELKTFRAGAFYYAIRFGVPIVPIVTVLRRQSPRHLSRSLSRRRRIKAEVHILPAIAPPAASGKSSTDLHNAIQFSRQIRQEIQRFIDEAGGDKSLYRGPMPRIKGVNDRAR